MQIFFMALFIVSKKFLTAENRRGLSVYCFQKDIPFLRNDNRVSFGIIEYRTICSLNLAKNGMSISQI